MTESPGNPLTDRPPSIIDRDWTVGVYTNDVGRAAGELLRETGLDGLTLRTVAELIPMSQSGLHRGVHGAAGLRELIVIALAEAWRRAFLTWGLPYSPDTESGAMVSRRPALPTSDDEIHDARLWLAARELARGEAAKGNPAALRPITHLCEIEHLQTRARLATAAGGAAPDDPTVDLVLATWRGLRDDIADPATALDPERAARTFERLWSECVVRLGEETGEAGSTDSANRSRAA